MHKRSRSTLPSTAELDQREFPWCFLGLNTTSGVASFEKIPMYPFTNTILIFRSCANFEHSSRISEVVRIVRKKLGWTNTRVLAVALTLAEALVKNCGAAVHREVASDRFMAAMAKVARVSSLKLSKHHPLPSATNFL